MAYSIVRGLFNGAPLDGAPLSATIEPFTCTGAPIDCNYENTSFIECVTIAERVQSVNHHWLYGCTAYTCNGVTHPIHGVKKRF